MIFVDGCFWHGCPKHATQPKNNRAFWRRKLAGNQQRDQLVTRTLCRAGWRVVRIWECDLARRSGICVRRIQQSLAIPPQVGDQKSEARQQRTWNDAVAGPRGCDASSQKRRHDALVA